jgi:hypothetical protein
MNLLTINFISEQILSIYLILLFLLLVQQHVESLHGGHAHAHAHAIFISTTM